MSKRNRSFETGPSRRALLVAAATLGALALSPRAMAQSARLLDAPRAAGTVGERYDGYAVARGAVAPDLAKLIDQVNAERRAIYAQEAKSKNAPIEEIGKIYAGQILKSAPPGTWFLGENGQWSRK
jgi:uncharacterized protein YdbL (DUF1318 family)